MRKPCTEFKEAFDGYFPEEFLASSYYVVVPQMPVPAYQFLEENGLVDLFNRDLEGLTLYDTYYVRPHIKGNARLHFHELVHVAQWKYLGVEGFVARYMDELMTDGYDDMLLERMAYEFEEQFAREGPVFDVPSTVESVLTNGTNQALK